ncbi:MAG: hypothetical protein FWE70_02115, partial [Oscillospiraceae bacterium]|nr:hypothetical protein [Oscillospiraceae bacterium]
RMADVLTDGIRGLILEACGYSVSIEEYVSPLDTPKNLMITALRCGGPDEAKASAYSELKGALGVDLALGRALIDNGAYRKHN